MWTHSSSRRRRGNAKPVIAVLVLLAVGTLAITYWTSSWIFKKPVRSVELAATAAVPAPEVPASDTDPAPNEDERAFELGRPETSPAIDRTLVDKAEAELKALRGGEPDALRRRIGVLALDERYPRDVRAAWLIEARELSQRVVFSASAMPRALTVPVGHGDTLAEICTKLRKEQKATVTPRFLEMVNDVSAARLRAGSSLKVPTEAMSILVDKDEYRLYVLLGGCVIKDYPIGIGKNEKTPEGRFTIQSKVKNPQWTNPETGKALNVGEPGHLIGTRWMSFSNEHGKTGFGIHGTTEPDSIGRAESAGCVRMLKADVEELYDLVPQGSEVVIRR
jgi:lipoprotein-anchoring transpeptidase ErfK/SrfK